jgi:hypothetical protein
MNEIRILDGCDFAFQPWGYQTEPVNIPVAPSTDARLANLWLIVSDVEVPRPAAVDITVAGVTTRLEGALLDTEGPQIDVVKLDVTVPAGASNVTIQVLSIDDESNLVPASLFWHFTGWVIPEPYTPPGGCTYTIGYWKNHPYDWPTDALSLFSRYEAMCILWTPPKKGNAYLILAHQYIGAELNVVNGASIPDAVLEAWFCAQELLETYMAAGDIPKKSPDRALAINLACMLDDYNNGLIGPGHCDEECKKPVK